MTPKKKLGARTVAGLKAPKTGRSTVWDSELTGFGVRLSARGKVYVARYRMKDGTQGLVTLGATNVLTASEARIAAKKALGDAARGVNPAEQRRAARGREKPLTFTELADSWLEDHARPKRRTWKEDERRLKLVKDYLGPKKRADDVTMLDLTRLHREIGTTKGETEANRTITTVRAVFGKAVAWKVLPRDFDNPASGVDLYKEARRTRIVRRDEFPALLSAIQAYGDPIVAGALLTLVFTGLRRNDVLNLRWSDVDQDAGFMRLRAQKTGDVRMLAISEPTRRVFNALPRFEGNPYVFPGRKKGRPLQSLKVAWTMIRTQAGCPDLRMHDLKRTVGTLLALAGENPFVIQQVLGHRDERTARYYVQLAAEMTSGVMDRYAAQVEAAATPKALVGGPQS